MWGGGDVIDFGSFGGLVLWCIMVWIVLCFNSGEITDFWWGWWSDMGRICVGLGECELGIGGF